MQSPADRKLTDVIGAIPYRMAFAGGWIDQPFVSRCNPSPPGSMVVVALEPTFRFMDRSGMATGTRNVALRLWNGKLPERAAAELVRELYAEENRGKPEPSGSQDMIGLIYPGVSRLDFDASHEGGVFPAHIESNNDPAIGSLAGEGDPHGPRGAAAGRLQPAGREEPRSSLDLPAGPVGQGLLRRNPPQGRPRPGRLDERVHEMLGGDPAADDPASYADRSTCRRCWRTTSPATPGRCTPAAAAATSMLFRRKKYPARCGSRSELPKIGNRMASACRERPPWRSGDLQQPFFVGHGTPRRAFPTEPPMCRKCL